MAKVTKGGAVKLVAKGAKGAKPSSNGKVAKVAKVAEPAKVERANPTNTVKKEYEKATKGVNIKVVPVNGRGGNRVTVWGFNICAILRWFGSKGYGAGRATKFLAAVDLTGVVGTSTVGCQVYGWETRGDLPDLSKDQIKILEKLSA